MSRDNIGASYSMLSNTLNFPLDGEKYSTEKVCLALNKPPIAPLHLNGLGKQHVFLKKTFFRFSFRAG
jgi:hypothetical protein